MIKHDDGSVTLTAQEFHVCAAFCEMSSRELAEILEAKEGELTTEDLLRHVLQRVALLNFEPTGQESAN